MGGGALGAALALAAVIALILLVRRVLAVFPAAFGPLAQTARGGGMLAVEQVLTIGPRRRLMVVRVGARRVLLLTGAAQDVVVGWLDPEATP